MKRNNQRLLLAVLKIVKEDANVDIIVSDEVSYVDINHIINNLKRNGLITDLMGYLEITERGKRQLVELEKDLGYGNIEKLVIPQYKDIIDKLDKFDVYLP